MNDELHKAIVLIANAFERRFPVIYNRHMGDTFPRLVIHGDGSGHFEDTGEPDCSFDNAHEAVEILAKS